MEPATEGGSGTRAARVDCEGKLVLTCESGDVGSLTLEDTGAAAYDAQPSLRTQESLLVHACGVVRLSDEPLPEDTLLFEFEPSSAACQHAAERVYGSLPAALGARLSPELREDG